MPENSVQRHGHISDLSWYPLFNQVLKPSHEQAQEDVDEDLSFVVDYSPKMAPFVGQPRKGSGLLLYVQTPLPAGICCAL